MASSYMVGNAPQGGSYSAPLIGMQLGQAINQLPQDFAKGQQYARTVDQQQAFRNGIPKDASGNPDTAAMAQTLIKLGGAETAQALLPTLIQQQTAASAGNSLEPGGGNPAPQGAQPAPGGPPAQGTPLGPSAPRPTANLTTSGLSTGPNTIASLAAGAVGDQDAGKLMPFLSRGLGGADPNAPLTDAQVAQAKVAIPNIMKALGIAPQAAPPVTDGSGAPQPNGATPQPPVNGQQPGATPPANGLPAGYTMQAADNKEALGQHYLALSARAAAMKNPELQKSYDDAAQQQFTDANKIRDAITAVTKPTDANLTAIQSGQPNALAMDQTKEVNAAAVKRSVATYGGIHAAATQYETQLKPALDVAGGILNNPAMYSGIGASASLDWNKIKAAVGDTQAAALQEGLQKINAISVLSQINEQKAQLQEAGGTSARIFSQQVEQVAKASASLENTVYGNRFLVNFQQRMGEFASTLDQMSRDYLKTHQILDTGFDQQMSDYIKSHPIFTKQEISDPRVLGAPSPPPNIQNKDQATAWAEQMGLKPGDPMRINGNVTYFKGPSK